MKKFILVLLTFCIMLSLCSCRSSDYKEAMVLYNEKQYEQAKEIFVSLGDYKDSAEMLLQCKYQSALQLYNDGKYKEAVAGFVDVIGYDNSNDAIRKIMFDLITGDFQQYLTDATTHLGEYVKDETNSFMLWVLGGVNGDYTFDYENEHLSDMNNDMTKLREAANNINDIFTKDIIDKCDSETQVAYEKFNEVYQYATSLYTSSNAMMYVADTISPSGEKVYAPDGMVKILGELEDATNNLK